MSALGHKRTSERGSGCPLYPPAKCQKRTSIKPLWCEEFAKPLSKPNKGRIKVQLGTSAAWLNAWALSGVGATRYEEVL